MVTGGRYLLCTPNGHPVFIVPAGGDKHQVSKVTIETLDDPVPQVNAFHVVWNIDSDAEAGSDASQVETHHQSLLKSIRDRYPDAKVSDGVIGLGDGVRFVHPVIWWTPDGPTQGVPSKQCLERLVCAALAQVYPGRAAEVEVWLSSRTDPPTATPKDHSWSYMAGWYAEHGCADFWQAVWRDDDVRAALLRRLTHIGAAGSLEAALGMTGPATPPAPDTPSA